MTEIVSGLIAWRDDPTQAAFDRRVVVAEDHDEIIAVAAHERSENLRGPLTEIRYLMVIAVRHDRRRDGIARVVAESVVADMQHHGVHLVHWLVYPTNLASITFSRSVFPDAYETYPPDDAPYASFTLSL